MTRLATAFRIRMADPHAVLQRQVAICGVVLVSLLIFLRPDINAGSDWWVVLAVGLVLAATAVPMILPTDHRPRLLLLAIPLADLLAVGALRGTTGGASSLFGTLLVLPVISLGIERGRLPVLVAAAGCATVIGVPIVFSTAPDDWLRVITAPVVFTLTALTVNVLSRRLRGLVRSEKRLRGEQQMLLLEAEQHSAATVEVAALLRQSAALMSGVVDAVTEQFIIATDAIGRVEVFNRGAQRMLDLPATDVLTHRLLDVVGGRFARFLPGGSPTAPAETLAQYGFDALVADARDGRAAASAWTYERSGGASVTVELSITVRRGLTGAVDGFLIVGTDVSEVYEQARLKDEFVSLISHELRTPLSSIIGYLELLADDEDQPLSAEQQHFLSIVDRNAHRLLRLVGDLLFTAALEAGKPSLEVAELDLAVVAGNAVMSARPMATTAGITVTVVVPESPVLILGDASRLGQVCDNLLSNAIKFTPRGGDVVVSLIAVDDGDEWTAPAKECTDTPERPPVATLAVSDTGMGIPGAEIEQLFGRFFRTSTATSNAVPGIGLGLSISRAIVVAHGGTISVESQAGKGSTFTVELPAIAVGDHRFSARPVPEGSSAGTG